MCVHKSMKCCTKTHSIFNHNWPFNLWYEICLRVVLNYADFDYSHLIRYFLCKCMIAQNAKSDLNFHYQAIRKKVAFAISSIFTCILPLMRPLKINFAKSIIYECYQRLCFAWERRMGSFLFINQICMH